MRYAEKIVGRAMKIHYGNQFVDEFRGFRSNDVATENFTRLRMTEYFYVSVRFTQTESLSMVVKGVGSGEIGNVAVSTLPFGQTDAGHLGIGKDNQGVETVIIVLGRLIRMNRVPSGNFTLLNGNMDDLVQAIHVSNGKDMRLGCSHVLANLYGFFLSGNLRCVQIEGVDIRAAA